MYIYTHTHTYIHIHIHREAVSQVVLVLKNPPANAGDLIPGLGRSPGRGNVNPLQYSWLENPLERGACYGA